MCKISSSWEVNAFIKFIHELKSEKSIIYLYIVELVKKTFGEVKHYTIGLVFTQVVSISKVRNPNVILQLSQKLLISPSSYQS